MNNTVTKGADGRFIINLSEGDNQVNICERADGRFDVHADGKKLVLNPTEMRDWCRAKLDQPRA